MPETTEFRTPGQLIESLLADRGWEQKFLAHWLGVSETIVSRTVNGVRPVDAQMALKLSEVFGVPPERFLMLQQSIALEKAKLITPLDPSRAAKATLFGSLPISEMIKRGWLKVKSAKDVEGVARELEKFFGVPSLDEIE